MLQKQLAGQCHFQWISSRIRVGLEHCQVEFAKIVETSVKGEQQKVRADA